MSEESISSNTMPKFLLCVWLQTSLSNFEIYFQVFQLKSKWLAKHVPLAMNVSGPLGHVWGPKSKVKLVETKDNVLLALGSEIIVNFI